MGYGFPAKHARTFWKGNERAKEDQYAVVRFRGRSDMRGKRRITIQKKGGEQMAKDNFLTVEDVADELSISKSFAYKIMRKLNAELEQKGFITVTGRVNKHYFYERLYCHNAGSEETERR